MNLTKPATDLSIGDTIVSSWPTPATVLSFRLVEAESNPFDSEDFVEVQVAVTHKQAVSAVGYTRDYIHFEVDEVVTITGEISHTCPLRNDSPNAPKAYFSSQAECPACR
jgi:hypothetical protein